MYKKILITTAILVSSFIHAQQVINPNIQHDWEDIRYTVNTDNTVLDIKTGLIWKKCEEGLSNPDCTTGNTTTYTWQQALHLANNNSFAGFNDWRLPNIKELGTLSAYDRSRPSLNISIFPNGLSGTLWSSTPYESNPFRAWTLNLVSGHVSTYNRDDSKSVRIVRGGY